MNAKSVREEIKEAMELENEYARISESEMIYLDEINLWEKSKKIAVFLFFASFCLIVISSSPLPQHIPILDLFPEYPLQVSGLFVGFGLMVTSMVATKLLSDRTSKIQNELRLHREERIYLSAYETSTSINSYLNQSKKEIILQETSFAECPRTN